MWIRPSRPGRASHDLPHVAALYSTARSRSLPCPVSRGREAPRRTPRAVRLRTPPPHSLSDQTARPSRLAAEAVAPGTVPPLSSFICGTRFARLDCALRTARRRRRLESESHDWPIRARAAVENRPILHEPILQTPRGATGPRPGRFRFARLIVDRSFVDNWRIYVTLR